MEELLPARKWTVAGSKEGRGRKRSNVSSGHRCHNEAGCPSHQQFLGPRARLMGPSTGTVGGQLLSPWSYLVPPGVRGSLGSADPWLEPQEERDTL